MDYQINEAIILAGGLGTRLKSEIGDHPKSLAPIDGQPFLAYLLRYLKKNGISSVILAVGYKHQLIIDAFGEEWEGMKITYSIETELMGTGGALKLALEKSNSEQLFVLNGDTFFDIDLQQLAKFHNQKKSTCTIALKELDNVDRYGNVVLDEEQKIIGFKEKAYREKALINGGIYCINYGILIHYPVGTPFSFEGNYLERNTPAKNIFGCIYTDYFIDIGVPQDYKKFQEDSSK